MILVWVVVIAISASTPMLLSIYSAEFYPIFGVTIDEWLSTVTATLPLWFSLIVLAVQQISDQRRDNRMYQRALQEKYDAETSVYNGTFLHLSYSAHQKIRHLAQAVSQIEKLSEHPAMECFFEKWRQTIKSRVFLGMV